MQPVLHIHEVSKTFHTDQHITPVLDGISLDVHEGISRRSSDQAAAEKVRCLKSSPVLTANTVATSY